MCNWLVYLLKKAEETRAVLAALIEKAVPMLRPYSEKIPVPVPVAYILVNNIFQYVTTTKGSYLVRGK